MWPSNIPPFNNPIFNAEHLFSEWLESVRKCVECTFGIMKGRFRQLKTGTRNHGHVSTDRIWVTCCALHNMLIDVDGLNENWESGVPSDREGELGQYYGSDVSNNIPTEILERMQNEEIGISSYDSSGQGRSPDHSEDDTNPNLLFEGIEPDDNDDSI